MSPSSDDRGLWSTDEAAGDSRFRALLGEVAAAPVGTDPGLELPSRGEVLEGDFEVLTPLGSGGMADVFLARDLRLGRHVAVKIARLPSERLAERARLALREQIATARMSHPNVVTIYGVGAWRDRPFLVLELVRGESLRERLRSGPVPLTEVLDIASQILAGLSHAHERGIVHQDIKPSNVMLTDEGVVKILDFGLADLDARRTTLVDALGEEPDEASPRGGTPGYMAPEQWQSSAADALTDVWLVGVLLFESIAGQLPFAGRDACTADAPAPRLDDLVPDTPPALADAVARALAKRPEDRFQSAAEMAAALGAVTTARARQADAATPYWSLRPFSEADAQWFFGRRREVAELQRRCWDTPLLVIVGPSGAGKSSLVHAGLVPALRRAAPTLAVVRLRPGRQPLEVLHRRLMEHADALAKESVPTPAELARAPGSFGHLLRQRAREAGRRFVIVVDQLEELWSQADREQRVPFLNAIMGAGDDAEGPLRVVATIRDDYLSSLAEFRELQAELARGLFVLGRPDPASLREALVEPARRLGYRFEDGVAEAVVDGLSAVPSAPLPLLQAAAARLWRRRDRERRVLTHEALDELEGLAGVLAQHADEVLRRLPEPLDRRIARHILTMLVVEAPTGYSSRPIPTGRVLVRCGDEERAARVLITLIEGGLVSRGPAEEDDPNAGTTLCLSHEALIQAWDTLAGWLRDSPERRRVREHLADAALQWERARRPTALLYGQVELLQAAALLGSDGGLHPTEVAFLEASRARGLRRTRLRWAFSATVVALALGFGIGVLASRSSDPPPDDVPTVRAPGVAGAAYDDEGLLMVGDDYELHVRDGRIYVVPATCGPRVRSWAELRELYRSEDGEPLPGGQPTDQTLELPFLSLDDLECVRRGLPCVLSPCGPGSGE